MSAFIAVFNPDGDDADLGGLGIHNNDIVWVDVTGTTLTLDASYNGKGIRFTSASNITVTVTGIEKGFNCFWKQCGAGVPTFTAGSGQAAETYGSKVKSAGQYACGGVVSDVTGKYTLFGEITT
jgi:hypothetical protein